MSSMTKNGTILATSLAFLISAQGAWASTVDLTTLTLNGGATATANNLNLGDNNGGEAMSGFLPTAISSNSGFSGSFNFKLIDGGAIADPAVGTQADGIAFVIQNAGPNALGGGGGGIGADGIANGIGIGFQSWSNNHATIFQTGVPGDVYNGTGAIGNFRLGTDISDVPIPSDHVAVTFLYSLGVLSFTAFNSDTLQSISSSLNIDLTTLGPNIYLGFTGGTGLGYAFQDVTDFDLTVSAVPLHPSTWSTMILGFAAFGFIAYRRKSKPALVLLGV